MGAMDFKVGLVAPEAGQVMTVPCGQCIGCRIDRSRAWAARCVCEAQMHEASSFITITFDDDHLPEDGSLSVETFQEFNKRLRDYVSRYYGVKYRFYACGEYGSQNQRPHYHAIIFGFDFPDKYLWQVRNGYKLYRSPILEKAWTFGYSLIGECTFESAAYVARYCTKKFTNPDPKKVEEHYQGRLPEFSLSSNRPGLGAEWLKKYKDSVIVGDCVMTIDKKRVPIPRYFNKLLFELYPEKYLELEVKREEKRRDKSSDPPRFSTSSFFDTLDEFEALNADLSVKEAVRSKKFNKLIRPLE